MTALPQFVRKRKATSSLANTILFEFERMIVVVRRDTCESASKRFWIRDVRREKTMTLVEEPGVCVSIACSL